MKMNFMQYTKRGKIEFPPAFHTFASPAKQPSNPILSKGCGQPGINTHFQGKLTYA